MKESGILDRVRLAVQSLGCTLFRNTVGTLHVIDAKTGDERWIKVGLQVGSSDGIGLTTVIIQPWMIGKRMAIFTAIETKRPKFGKKSPEQIAFVDWVKVKGGIAGFAESVEQAEAIIRDFTEGGK